MRKAILCGILLFLFGAGARASASKEEPRRVIQQTPHWQLHVELDAMTDKESRRYAEFRDQLDMLNVYCAKGQPEVYWYIGGEGRDKVDATTRPFQPAYRFDNLPPAATAWSYGLNGGYLHGADAAEFVRLAVGPVKTLLVRKVRRDGFFEDLRISMTGASSAISQALINCR